MSGKLFVVATPIGNIADMTFRGVETLKSVDLIVSEDTRRTGILLKHYSITTHQLPYHDHNKEKVTPRIIIQLLDGKNVAVVSDAGTPGISDPGFYLIRECLKNNIEVIPVPGPSSIIAAIVISGLPTDRFCFEGFLPRTTGKMKKRLDELKGDKRTIVVFESAMRINRTLAMILEVLGDRDAFVGRELTKKFEQTYRNKVSELIEIFKDKPPRGELVLVVAGKREDIG
jgi:16S rRNA (cytidine1402-2'-O)-methyltransferase